MSGTLSGLCDTWTKRKEEMKIGLIMLGPLPPAAITTKYFQKYSREIWFVVPVSSCPACPRNLTVLYYLNIGKNVAARSFDDFSQMKFFLFPLP